MAFDQATRNRLQKFVSDARKLLSEEFTQQLQNTYGLDPITGGIAGLGDLPGLSPTEQQTAKLLRDTLEHYLAASHKADPYADIALITAMLGRIVREQAFTVINRLAALRMAETRQFVEESISQGYQSRGFQLYQRIAGGALGETGQAYQAYLFSVFDELSLDLAVLFDRYSSQGRLFPRESVLLELLDLINHAELERLWVEDETIGWMYQYFNSKEERKKMRDESRAPRNSRELAVRNQFFTPRYVVEFLTDNTLGRIWYEMTQGNTTLVDSCQYLVCQPNEIFLEADQQAPEVERDALIEPSQEDLSQQTVYIQRRPLKDPRDIKMLDPACGSMHFGLYAFDLFEKIYSEAWEIEALGGYEKFSGSNGNSDDCTAKKKPSLHQSYESKEAFLSDVPKLIIEYNIHGVDIDPRAAQIAGLSLWLRAQKSWLDNSIKPNRRPQIQRSNIVCAEPMPGETQLLEELTSQIKPSVLGQLVEEIFDQMQLASEAGTLLKIEEEIQSAIKEAKSQADENELEVQGRLFGDHKWEGREDKRYYNFGDVGDGFWNQAEQLILSQLERYAETTADESSGQKRLFAADAAKGFAFIDLCRKRFDVVLMNPPFGQGSIQARKLIEKEYKNVKKELAACFISRARSLLNAGGKVGCLATRLLLSLPTYKQWRHEEFIGQNSISVLADLGYGVLDAAVVEAAAYIQSRDELRTGIFIDCLQSKDKETALKEKVKIITTENIRELEKFRHLPASVIAHFISNDTIRKISCNRQLVDSGVRAYVGISTADDFRFLRLSWELFPDYEAAKWKPFAKGGEWSPFWDDIHLEVNWNLDGGEIASSGGLIINYITQGKAGLTYPERTTSSFGPRILPNTTIYSIAGMGIFSDDLDLLVATMSLLLSRQGQFLVEMSLSGGDSSVSGTAARHYTIGMVNRLPFPSIDENRAELKQLTLKIIELKRKVFEGSEISRDYAPSMLKGNGCREVSLNYLESLLLNLKEQAELLGELSNLVDGFFGFDDAELAPVVGPNPWNYGDVNSDDSGKVIELYSKTEQELISIAIDKFGGGARYITKNCQLLNRKIELIAHITQNNPLSIIDLLLSHIEVILTTQMLKNTALMLLSQSVGYVFGRWMPDKNERIGGLFDRPRPISYGDSKKIFHSEDGESISGSLDEVVNENLANKGEKLDLGEIKELLGFTKNSALWNAFFEYHLSVYSKSGRQAPIYWPLQISSGRYKLWVCFHSLDEQILYRCVNDFLDGPDRKISEVNDRIASMRNRSSRSNDEEKVLEDLISFELELRDFRDELLRIAEFWKPDLNDGVLIIAAPLWRLFGNPKFQKTLISTWSELESGKLDWSKMAYSIWPERVLRKCSQNRSIAIAHGVEIDLWEEVELSVGKTNKTKLVWRSKEMSEAQLDAYIQQKIAQG